MRTEPLAGRYEQIAPIDAGGMGEVWRGYDGVLDRETAYPRSTTRCWTARTSRSTW